MPWDIILTTVVLPLAGYVVQRIVRSEGKRTRAVLTAVEQARKVRDVAKLVWPVIELLATRHGWDWARKAREGYELGLDKLRDLGVPLAALTPELGALLRSELAAISATDKVGRLRNGHAATVKLDDATLSAFRGGGMLR